MHVLLVESYYNVMVSEKNFKGRHECQNCRSRISNPTVFVGRHSARQSC